MPSRWRWAKTGGGVIGRRGYRRGRPPGKFGSVKRMFAQILLMTFSRTGKLQRSMWGRRQGKRGKNDEIEAHPALALALAALGPASQAKANVWWTLEDVTFSDGGTATGDIVIDGYGYAGGIGDDHGDGGRGRVFARSAAVDDWPTDLQVTFQQTNDFVSQGYQCPGADVPESSDDLGDGR